MPNEVRHRVTSSKPRRYRMVARAQAAAATRSRLLTAAWRHFADRSFEDVRLSGIAADAGVSVQTLHAHFGTKDALFVETWAWRMAPEGARRDRAPSGDVAAAVSMLYESYELDGDAVLRLSSQEQRIAAVHEMLEDGRQWHRGWVERTFGDLVEGVDGAERERCIVSIVVATDLLVWKLLRREMGLDRVMAERIVTDMVNRARGAS